VVLCLLNLDGVDVMKADKPEKILVVQVAGLGFDFLSEQCGTAMAGMTFRPLDPVFPALTCSAQASFRTAALPSVHGLAGNGIYDRRLRKPLFWEQSSALVDGPRIWAKARAAGRRVALLFWQQSMGEEVDMILSPAPIHRHHGGMILDCYSQPAGLYKTLCRRLGRPFALKHYWGPLASAKSSQWIAEATAAVLDDPALAPDVCMTYLPVLDYDLQRYGTHHARSAVALAALRGQLELLAAAAARNGYGLVVFGDYAIADCPRGAVLPNAALAADGLLKLRDIEGMLYADLHASRAFAMVDHEVAQVVVRDLKAREAAAAVLGRLDGVGEVMDAGAQQRAGVAHPRVGDLMLVAADGCWLAYPWWTDLRQAPDYARHVDIHNKPGYDPVELFWGWPPGSVSLDTGRIKGSHGRIGSGRQAAWAATCGVGGAGGRQPASLVDLAQAVQAWI